MRALWLLAPIAAALTRLECLTDRSRGFARGAWADALADGRALANRSYTPAWRTAVLGDLAHAGRRFFWRPERPECELRATTQFSLCATFDALDVRFDNKAMAEAAS